MPIPRATEAVASGLVAHTTVRTAAYLGLEDGAFEMLTCCAFVFGLAFALPVPLVSTDLSVLRGCDPRRPVWAAHKLTSDTLHLV